MKSKKREPLVSEGIADGILDIPQHHQLLEERIIAAWNRAADQLSATPWEDLPEKTRACAKTVAASFYSLAVLEDALGV